LTGHVLITVEHASNRLPPELDVLGLSPEALQSHVAWDPGALQLGRALQATIGGELLAGEWSRLLVDLNRSETNPRVAPARSFGVDIPGNRGLSHDQVHRRIETVWRPFRAKAREAVKRSRRCLHFSVHTFTPELAGALRDFDFAVLYDPARDWERRLAAEIVACWRSAGWKARRNAPYRGVADGHTTALRREFPAERYAGLEIEVNQRGLAEWERVTAGAVDGIRETLEKQKTRH
jgi:predicted N-formylglutamate amidohydrolase